MNVLLGSARVNWKNIRKCLSGILSGNSYGRHCPHFPLNPYVLVLPNSSMILQPASWPKKILVVLFFCPLFLYFLVPLQIFTPLFRRSETVSAKSPEWVFALVTLRLHKKYILGRKWNAIWTVSANIKDLMSTRACWMDLYMIKVPWPACAKSARQTRANFHYM